MWSARCATPTATPAPSWRAAGWGRPSPTPRSRPKIDAELHRIVTEQYDKAIDLFANNGHLLELMAEALLEFEALDANEIEELLEHESLEPLREAPGRKKAAEAEGDEKERKERVPKTGFSSKLKGSARGPDQATPAGRRPVDLSASRFCALEKSGAPHWGALKHAPRPDRRASSHAPPSLTRSIRPTQERPIPHASCPPPPTVAPLRLPDGRELSFGARRRVMGIVNVTPDSFSDGGEHAAPPDAIAHGCGCSSRAPTSSTSAASRRAPAPTRWIETRSSRASCRSSRGARRGARRAALIDTTKSAVARRRRRGRARTWSTMSPGWTADDPAHAEVVAEANAPLVLMHMRGTPKTMQPDDRLRGSRRGDLRALGRAGRARSKPASSAPNRARPGHRVRQIRRPTTC